jgi:hypothetical protein
MGTQEHRIVMARVLHCIYIYIITIPKEKNKKEMTGRVKGMTIGQSSVLGTGAECMLLS